MKCKICDTEAKLYHYNKTGDFSLSQTIDCPKCGQYNKSFNFETGIYTDKSDFYKVSSWIREQNDFFNNTPLINNEKFEEILNMRDKKIKEKLDLMLNYLSTLKEWSQLNEEILVKCFIKSTSELNILIEKAYNHGLIDVNITKTMGGYPIFKNITFDGLQYIEELEEPNKNSKKIFVAFNFGEPLTDIFNTDLKTAIENEGFEYVVVNQENVEHNQSINDEIIVKLKTSRIVIADFTNHRNSVYFEAGYAMGMNIPIIWTCQKGHEDDMSFDTRQFPHIVWKDKDDLVQQVITRIKRII